MSKLICSKCGKNMDEGFVLDSGLAGNLQSAWAEGKPRRSMWTGIKLAKDAFHSITTFRCQGCGYLESYATVA
jgi:hypothetical protein